MVARNSAFIKSLHVEVHMLEPYFFNPDNEVIKGYIHQLISQFRGGVAPPLGTLIPVQIGSSSGIIKIVAKAPASAFKLPPDRKPDEYLKVEFRRAVTRNQGPSKWAYRPSDMEPLWEDEAQHRNAKLLRTYLTNPGAKRLSPLILMDGAPGTGKTMTSDFVLSKLDRPFNILKHICVSSAYVGDTAQNLMELTRQAIDLKPCIVILEEADGTFISRWLPESAGGTSRQHAAELVSALLQCLDIMAREGDIFIIATTNMNPDDMYIIDPAILSRVGLRLSFRNPSNEVVRKVMKMMAEKGQVPLENVECAMSEIVGARRPNYRDITMAISRAHMMELAGLDYIGMKPWKPKEPKELEYIG